MRLILTTVAAACAAVGLAGTAFAHGGSYRGPAGEIPPDSREPSDPPPPPEGTGPGTPTGEDPGGPTTDPGGVGGPGTDGGNGGGPNSGGNGGPPPSGGNGSGPTTSGSGRKLGTSKSVGYEDWTFWWNHNKDELLTLRSRLRRAHVGAPTGTGAHRIGRRGDGDVVRLATDSVIQTQIVPALRDLLDDDELNFDIQSAAALGLAKIGDGTIVPRLRDMVRNEGKQRFNKVVEESAALAFGLLQQDSPEVREFLLDTVGDKSLNSSYVRPFAAVSLGLIGAADDRDGAVPQALLSAIDRRESKEDVKPACLLALGLLGSDAQAKALLGMLRSGKTSDGGSELSATERAYVVQALGKIGGVGVGGRGTEVLDAILDLTDVRQRGEDRNVRRSAAIALGQLGARLGAADEKPRTRILAALKDLVNEGREDQERNFAVMSLGRIASAEGADPAARAEVVKALRFYLEKKEGHTPTFAALALGLVGRRLQASGQPFDDESIGAPIRRRFAKTREPRLRGAYAVASGLAGDPHAVKDLVAVLEDDRADPRLRGYCALGLGLIGDTSARDPIRDVLRREPDRDVRVQTAVAAGLMGDLGAVPELLEILQSDTSQYVLGSVTLALGQIGDDRAVPPLLAIVKDGERYPDLTRALATVALGQIGDRRDVPTLARVSTDVNYRAHVPAITELLSIL